jgi:hypothetical protein
MICVLGNKYVIHSFTEDARRIGLKTLNVVNSKSILKKTGCSTVFNAEKKVSLFME